MIFVAEILDKDLNALGRLQEHELNDLKISLSLNDIGTFSFSVPLYIHNDLNYTANVIRQNEGIYIKIWKDERHLLSGYVTQVTQELKPEGATLSVSGYDVNYFLSNVLAFPSPNRDADKQTVQAYDTQTGPAGAVLHHYLNENFARFDLLTSAISSELGETVTYSARYATLLEICQDVLQGQNLRILGVIDIENKTIVYTLEEVRDWSRQIVLQEDSGDISNFSITRLAPTVTNVIALGQGEGTERTTLEIKNEYADYPRLELAYDYSNAEDVDELTKGANNKLADGALSIQANSKLGNLLRDIEPEPGDLIGVYVFDTLYILPLTQIAWSGSGTIAATLGDISTSDAYYLSLKRLSKKINDINKNNFML